MGYGLWAHQHMAVCYVHGSVSCGWQYAMCPFSLSMVSARAPSIEFVVACAAPCSVFCSRGTIAW